MVFEVDPTTIIKIHTYSYAYVHTANIEMMLPRTTKIFTPWNVWTPPSNNFVCLFILNQCSILNFENPLFLVFNSMLTYLAGQRSWGFRCVIYISFSKSIPYCIVFVALCGRFRSKQGILEIEDGAILEDEQTHEIVRERCPNISNQKYFGCSGKRRRMHVCVWILRSQKAVSPHRWAFWYLHKPCWSLAVEVNYVLQRVWRWSARHI